MSICVKRPNVTQLRTLLRGHQTELQILETYLRRKGGSFRKRERQEAQCKRLKEVLIPRDEQRVHEVAEETAV